MVVFLPPRSHNPAVRTRDNVRIPPTLDFCVRKVLGMSRAQAEEKDSEEKVVTACGGTAGIGVTIIIHLSFCKLFSYICTKATITKGDGEVLSAPHCQRTLASSTNPMVKSFEKIIQSISPHETLNRERIFVRSEAIETNWQIHTHID